MVCEAGLVSEVGAASDAWTGKASEVAILLGRGMPLGEQRQSLAAIGAELVEAGQVGRYALAFAEMSEPSLESVLVQLRDEGIGSCVIIPVIVPFDRNLRGWIGRWLSRWSGDHAAAMRVVLADPVDGVSSLLRPVSEAIAQAADRADVRDAIKPLKIKAGASQIPDVNKMALVCLGPRCAQAGGFAIYDRLRRRFGPHRPRGLDDDPLLCLRTNCQGPCNFAPLVAIQPDNVWYGQLTDTALDRIIDEHLAHGGSPLAEWSLHPGERLRQADGHLAEPDYPLASARNGTLGLRDLFARSAMQHDAALAAFMAISNASDEADALVAVHSPVSRRLAVHDAGATHEAAGHDHLAAGAGLPLAIPARSTVQLEPGRLHLMIMDVADVPDPGATLALSFEFAKAGRIDIECYIMAPA